METTEILNFTEELCNELFENIEEIKEETVEDLIKDIVKLVKILLDTDLNEGDKEMVENIAFNIINEKVFHYIKIEEFPNSFRDIAEKIDNMVDNDVIDFDSVKISRDLEGIRDDIKKLKAYYSQEFQNIIYFYNELFDEDVMNLTKKVKTIKEISRIIGDLSEEEFEYCLS